MTHIAHVFGDDINTDYIIAAQHKATTLDIQEMARHTFEDIDPSFAERVRPGDFVVAGRNFGCGSSRETAPRVLLALGIQAVVAKSFARIFFRNAVNTGLQVLTCDTSQIRQGDRLELSAEEVRDESRGLTLPTGAVSPRMRAFIAAGGVAEIVRKYGDLVLPETTFPTDRA